MIPFSDPVAGCILTFTSGLVVIQQNQCRDVILSESMPFGATPTVPTPERKLVRVQEKGQVTLPAELRRKHGLKKGDLAAVEETEEGLLITPPTSRGHEGAGPSQRDALGARAVSRRTHRLWAGDAWPDPERAI